MIWSDDCLHHCLVAVQFVDKLPEQTFAYKITLEIETSSHDGYCTENNKCEYRSKIKTCNITNEQLESLLGEYSLADIMGDPNLLEMDTLEPLVRDELVPRSWGTSVRLMKKVANTI